MSSWHRKSPKERLEDQWSRLHKGLDNGTVLHTMSSIDTGRKKEIRADIPASLHAAVKLYSSESDEQINDTITSFVTEALMDRVSLIDYLKQKRHPLIQHLVNTIEMNKVETLSEGRRKTIDTIRQILTKAQMTADPTAREELVQLIRDNRKTADMKIRTVCDEVLSILGEEL